MAIISSSMLESIVPLCAGVDVFNSLAVGSLDSQLNSLVADLVRVLGDGAVEPALTDRVLLGSASVEAGDDQARVLAALSELGCSKDEAVYVGDSEVDLHTGPKCRHAVYAGVVGFSRRRPFCVACLVLPSLPNVRQTFFHGSIHNADEQIMA